VVFFISFLRLPLPEGGGAQNAFFEQSSYKNDHFCQDRLGTNMGKVEETRRFVQETLCEHILGEAGTPAVVEALYQVRKRLFCAIYV
jgi:hypothetical protein